MRIGAETFSLSRPNRLMHGSVQAHAARGPDMHYLCSLFWITPAERIPVACYQWGCPNAPAARPDRIVSPGGAPQDCWSVASESLEPASCRPPGLGSDRAASASRTSRPPGCPWLVSLATCISLNKQPGDSAGPAAVFAPPSCSCVPPVFGPRCAVGARSAGRAERRRGSPLEQS